MAREIVIAGAGTGTLRHLTPEVQEAMNDADIIFADKRLHGFIPAGKRVNDIMNYAEIDREDGKILLLVSGDPGIFSLMPVIRRRFPNENITVLPGISSLQVICAKAGETWHNAAILSGHGRTLSAGKFLNTVERNRITVLFCDSNISPSWACEKLSCMSDVDVVIGSCLGSDDECVIRGSHEDFAGKIFPELSICLVRNNNIYIPERIHLRDKDFLREKDIVMTNEAVRSVIISRLEMKSDGVFWDIGAGSGSISVSIGHELPYSDIHAVECSPKAANLTSRNAARFRLHNITVHNSRAVDAIASLPEPSGRAAPSE